MVGAFVLTGGVSGTFNPTVISNMATIQSTFTYDAHGAVVNMTLPPELQAMSDAVRGKSPASRLLQVSPAE